MYLKEYQIQVVKDITNFFESAKKIKEEIDRVSIALPDNQRHLLNWVQATFGSLKIDYKDTSKNGLDNFYPRIVMKVPTAGGKTLLAVEAINKYQNIYAKKRTGLIVWIVPSDSIYKQTVQNLKDKSHHLRQFVDQCSNGRTIILEKGEKISTQDINENLVILFIMIQSVSRTNNKEALKVFQDSGGFEGFFPSDNRYDLHEELIKKIPNLDCISDLSTRKPIIKTSLGNVIRCSNPFIIIDEIHRVFSPNAKNTIDSLNPEMVLGLTATPNKNMNIISLVNGIQLKNEGMVKLDMHIIPPTSDLENDWQSMLQKIKNHRDKLEEKSIELRQNTGEYIRPIALIQVEATGKGQRGKGKVHSLDVKQYLISLGINTDEIAIKTSSQNDIEDVDLFSKDCNVRYIITKEALREGWDCFFAYLLGIIPNVNSNTGVTQLVGRILRQPFARKLGIKELDESYVYFAKGNTLNILQSVELGFKKEGMEDLYSNIKINNNSSRNMTKTVKIKKDFLENYSNLLYLPYWAINDGSKKRKLNYDMDIRAYINFKDFTITNTLIDELKKSLSEERTEKNSFAVTIDEESKTKEYIEKYLYKATDDIDYGYMTRRFTEYIDNPFMARKKVNEFIDLLKLEIGEDILSNHFNFITSILVKYIEEEVRKQEEKIFFSYLSNNRLNLIVSDEDLDFKIPESDIINFSGTPNPYNYYLFEDIDISTMNSLEKNVANTLDKQDKIIWWVRNKTTKEWYFIQGWQENRIRPDFVVAKKNENNEIDIVYVLEAKGEHLLGNKDTEYKKKVLDSMTEQKNRNNIKKYSRLIGNNDLNEIVEFYLVEQGKEEEFTKSLFN